MKHSTPKVLSEAPTLRQNPIGIGDGWLTHWVAIVPSWYGRCAAPSIPWLSPLAPRVTPRWPRSDGETLRYFQPTIAPDASRPALAPMTPIGRYWSWRKSSSRGHINFTGRPTAMATWIAWEMKSCSHLRPKPPPSIVVVTVILEVGRPVIVDRKSTRLNSSHRT